MLVSGKRTPLQPLQLTSLPELENHSDEDLSTKENLALTGDGQYESFLLKQIYSGLTAILIKWLQYFTYPTIRNSSFHDLHALVLGL